MRNPEWSQDTDPNRKPLPGRFRRRAEREPGRHRQPADVGRPDVARHRHRRRAGRAGPGALRPGPQGPDGQPVARPPLVHVGEPDRSHRWTTSTAARRSCTPPTRPATSAPCGGDVAGGDIATNILPPLIPGSQDIDLYPSEGNKGDVDKAKAALKDCGQPNGFSTNISYRNERPAEKAAAESLQQSLKRVGINVDAEGLPAGRLLLAVRRQARRTQAEQARPRGQRLGCGLERRFRLPLPDRRQPGDPGHGWLVEHQRPDPGGRQDARRGARRAGHRPSASRSGPTSTRRSWTRP